MFLQHPGGGRVRRCCLLLGLILLAAWPMVAWGANTRPIVGERAPEIEGKDLDGATFKLSDYRGKVVALTFWGDWCPFCRVMYSHERSLVEQHKDEPFVLIGVNSDSKDRLRGVLQSEKMTWRSFWDGGRIGGPIATAWGVHGWPSVYVIDDQGVIRFEKVRGDALDEAVDELLERSTTTLAKYGESDNPKLRSLAAFRMAKYNLPDAQARLTALQEHDNPIVRQRVAAGLALLGESPQPLLPLIRAAITDPDRSVRLAALKAVATAADREALARVIDATQDEEVKVRRAAIEVLGKLRDPSGITALAQAIDDKDSQTAKLAALTLAKFDRAEAIDDLRELAGRADHPARVWIAVALHHHDKAATLARFQSFLDAPDAALRREAIAALADLADVDAMDLEIGALADKDVEVRKTAAMALSKSSDPRASEAIEGYLTPVFDDLLPQLAEIRKVQRVMAKLRALGPAAAPPLLERLLADTQPRTQNFIAAVIGQLRNPAVIPRAIERLRDEALSQQLRYGLEGIISGLGSAAVPAVIPLASDDSAAVRKSAMRMLMRLNDDAARATLRLALKDSDSTVQAIAAGGLARHRDRDALPVLLEMISGDDRGLRASAARALGNYAADVALPVLLQLSKHDDPTTRASVISPLGHFTDKTATEAILRVAKEQPRSQSSAVQALRSQGTPEAVQAIGELVKTGNDSIRRFAESALRRLGTPEAERVLRDVAAAAPAKSKPRMPSRFPARITRPGEQPHAVVGPLMAIPKDHNVIKGWGRPVDPDGDCTFKVDDDGMTVAVPGTPHDLSVELKRMNAPRVLRKIAGDFTVEVKVSGKFSPGGASIASRASYNGAGLLLMLNERTYIRLERAVLLRREQQQHYANFEARVDGRIVRFGTPSDFKIDATKECYIRLQRKGNQIHGALRQGEDPWHALPAKTVQLPPQLWCGVTAVNASDQPFTVSFAGLSVVEHPGTPAAKGTGPPPAKAPFDADEAKKHQQKWADYLGLPVETTNSIGMKFVLIPPGEFFMGSPLDEVDRNANEQQHRVRITKPFYLSACEVTQQEYQKVMQENPNARQGMYAKRASEPGRNRIPITSVDWPQATNFCSTLAALPEECRRGRTYRLCTEAEWEYACRAGTTTAFHFGQEMDKQYASCETGFGGLKIVGSYAPNAFGLYDMHGNVIEWCADAYASNYYAKSPLDDPQGPPAPRSRRVNRVARGGGFVLKANLCRAATRLPYFAGQRTFAIGFRVAMDLPQQSPGTAAEIVPATKELVVQASEAARNRNFQKAIILAEQALAKNADDPKLLFLLASMYQGRGVAVAARDRSAANEFLLKSSKYMRRLRAVTKKLSFPQQSLLQRALYNEACVHAVTGEREKALECLEEACAAGFRDISRAKNDADLRSLHEEPRFKELIEARQKKLKRPATQKEGDTP